MKQPVRSIFTQLIFWLILFTVERTIFMLWYSNSIIREGVSFGEVLSVYTHAFKLDLATASYILVIPFLILVIQIFSKVRWLDVLNRLYASLVIIIYTLTCVSEIGLYKEWNTKLSFKALSYLQRPDEVFNSVQTSVFYILLLLLIVQAIVFIYIYNRFFFVKINFDTFKSHVLSRIAFVIIMPLLLFVGIRGGINEIPITASNSYFSKYNILNVTAVNSGYNIAFNLLDHTYLNEFEPFFKYTDEEAVKIVEEIYQIQKDTTILISKVQQPNIVFVLLESWPADVVESLGGDLGITPEFNNLEKEGLLFTNFYASGNRSQQGNASIFAGLPAIPITTLSDHPEKYDAVPSLVKILNTQGYYSSFYFGGQLNYGNLRSFLIHNEFDLIIEGDDFTDDMPRGKLGIHDEYLFNRYAKDIKRMSQPFFSTVFTLSSHSPYDYPGEQPIDWIEVENKFVNSVHYSDACLGEFFNSVSESEIWDNTLFFIMSDHSHLSYKDYPLWSFEYHQIPLLITGGALKGEFKSEKMDIICSNTDIPVTILKQLGLPTDSFKWSKNMLNPYTPEFAFFELNDGFGWKRPYGDIVKSATNKWYYQKNAPKNKRPQLEKEGYAYIQVLIKEFLSY